ncbi:hypothetical protein GCM10022402_22440 [Salinactinospora qingdaonensis]|uniref:Uncharacterized protein n=1 Tax=Salinactinospora qingdaonensis TaxID=702744 RepID=A0ABP7FR53_9ACTN
MQYRDSETVATGESVYYSVQVDEHSAPVVLRVQWLDDSPAADDVDTILQASAPPKPHHTPRHAPRQASPHGSRGAHLQACLYLPLARFSPFSLRWAAFPWVGWARRWRSLVRCTI